MSTNSTDVPHPGKDLTSATERHFIQHFLVQRSVYPGPAPDTVSLLELFDTSKITSRPAIGREISPTDVAVRSADGFTAAHNGEPVSNLLF